MSKIEETEYSKINDENQKNTFSLLLPYYTSDKWTNKLKRKIKTLANAYNSYYERIQQENNQFYKDKYNSNINKIQRKSKSFMNHKFIGNQNIFNRTSTGFMNYQTNSNFMNTNENINYNRRKLLNEIIPPVTNYNPNYDTNVYDGVTYLSDTGEPYVSYFYPKESNIFCISAQQKNQNTTMNKFYNNHKNKDNFFMEIIKIQLIQKIYLAVKAIMRNLINLYIIINLKIELIFLKRMIIILRLRWFNQKTEDKYLLLKI